MAIPTNVLSNFLTSFSSLEDDAFAGGDDGVNANEKGGEQLLSNVLGRHVENGINVDPIPLIQPRSSQPIHHLEICTYGFKHKL